MSPEDLKMYFESTKSSIQRFDRLRYLKFATVPFARFVFKIQSLRQRRFSASFPTASRIFQHGSARVVVLSRGCGV